MTLRMAAVVALVIASCGTAQVGPAATPKPTPAFGQAKLDIAYSFISDSSAHRPTSAQLLRGALDGMRSLVTTVGGNGDVATPTFTDASARTSTISGSSPPQRASSLPRTPS
jgi:hypothetical protein